MFLRVPIKKTVLFFIFGGGAWKQTIYGVENYLHIIGLLFMSSWTFIFWFKEIQIQFRTTTLYIVTIISIAQAMMQPLENWILRCIQLQVTTVQLLIYKRIVVTLFSNIGGTFKKHPHAKRALDFIPWLVLNDMRGTLKQKGGTPWEQINGVVLLSSLVSPLMSFAFLFPCVCFHKMTQCPNSF